LSDEKDDYEKVHTVSGSRLSILGVALKEAELRRLKLDAYDVALFESPSAWLVTFQAMDRPRELRGSPPGVPGLEVHIDKQSLEVTKAHFVR
jgi:hypothetical protein